MFKMKISVVLPTYNRATLLKASLESLIKLHPDEIIVIDDGSTDNTKEVLDEFKIKSKVCLKVIRHKERMGSTKAWNEGVEEAEGDLVFFTADDHFYPEFLFEKIKRLFNNDPKIGAVVLREKRRKTTRVTFKKRLFMLLTEWIIIEAYQQKKGYVKYGSGTMIVRRSIMKSVKYDEGYLGNCWREESQLQLDVQKLGWKIYFDPELCFQHIHTDYGGYRTFSHKEYEYWKIRNHTRFLKKNFPLKLPLFFFIFLQSKLRKGEVKTFLKAFKDGLKAR
jgi:glycosyltransferase involved in cell wall biosynthesis